MFNHKYALYYGSIGQCTISQWDVSLISFHLNSIRASGTCQAADEHGYAGISWGPGSEGTVVEAPDSLSSRLLFSSAREQPFDWSYVRIQ